MLYLYRLISTFLPIIHCTDTDESSGPAPEEVAAAMASSNHLWMKIASKYAHEAAGTTKSPVKDNLKRPANNDVNSRDKKKVKSVDESEPDLLGEQDRLIKEMKEKEKANRLLKENYFHFSIRYFFSSEATL